MRITVRPAVAAQCLTELRDSKIHRHFGGYLAVRRASAVAGKRTGLTVNFNEFYDTFLSVGGAPPKRPYAQPFCETAATPANKWLNENTAGSYAQSSLRVMGPLLRVIGVEGSGRHTEYQLLTRDPHLALENLAYGIRIPAFTLAAYLFRDHYLTAPDYDLTLDVIGRAFKNEFGFSEIEDEDFHALFDYESTLPEDWYAEI